MAASNNTNSYDANGVQQSFAGSAAGSAAPTSPTEGRLLQAGLAPGANGLLSDIAGKVFNIDFQSSGGTNIDAERDWRVRISMATNLAGKFLNSAILSPLIGTKGVIFPYTPTITINHNARYGQTPLTHSNYNSYFYEGSEVSAISINGEFTVQNIADGQYLMAAIQFFRTCTKMFWGADQNAGAPPPMVFLDGYGPAYLPHVPCVVTTFSHTMPADVDYVQIPVGLPIKGLAAGTPIASSNLGGPVRLPTSSTISISLQPVYSRNNLSNNFTLEKFSSGGLIQNGYSGIGGFI
jgi:hypothetical protein